MMKRVSCDPAGSAKPHLDFSALADTLMERRATGALRQAVEIEVIESTYDSQLGVSAPRPRAARALFFVDPSQQRKVHQLESCKIGLEVRNRTPAARRDARVTRSPITSFPDRGRTWSVAAGALWWWNAPLGSLCPPSAALASRSTLWHSQPLHSVKHG